MSEALKVLTIACGWILAVGLGGLWLVVLIKIATNKIDLAKVLAEANGGASMSRLQLLVFTFTVAGCFLFVALTSDPPALPTVPAEILALLGISAGSFVVSKGIQTSGEIAKLNQASGTPQSADATPPGSGPRVVPGSK